MQKYNAIELLRLYFVGLIIAGHTKMAGAVSDIMGTTFLSTQGSRVNIFMLICGFFLFNSMKKHSDKTFWERFKRRCMRILPALILYKVLCTLILGMSAGAGFENLLSNLFMLNQNIGVDVPTITHVIWYVDVMFWVYLLYMAMFEIFAHKHALFITGILMIMSLVALFTNPNVNLHFQMATTYMDGGVLRGIAFIGMGILLAALPLQKQTKNNGLSVPPPTIFATFAEIISVAAVFAFPLLFDVPTKTLVLNHTLWAAVFVFLMTRQYGYLSRIMNSWTCVGKLSKYCYEVYVFQYFAILLGGKWLSPRSFPILSVFGVIIFAFIIGIAVKELFDKRIVQKYLIKE